LSKTQIGAGRKKEKKREKERENPSI